MNTALKDIRFHLVRLMVDGEGHESNAIDEVGAAFDDLEAYFAAQQQRIAVLEEKVAELIDEVFGNIK